MNLEARSPNIGLPIFVSDYFIDFFFLNTFSPFAHTTLNSILQEKVAVKDLKHVIDNKLSTISSQNIHLDTSSSNIETCSSSSQSLPLGYRQSCHSSSIPWADTKNLSDSIYSAEKIKYKQYFSKI